MTCDKSNRINMASKNNYLYEYRNIYNPVVNVNSVKAS